MLLRSSFFIFSGSFKVNVIYLDYVKINDSNWMTEEIILSAISLYRESKQHILEVEK